MHTISTRFFFVLMTIALFQSSLSSQVYLDSTASAEARTEDLLGRMTNSQKMQYIGGYNSMYIRQGGRGDSPASHSSFPVVIPLQTGT